MAWESTDDPTLETRERGEEPETVDHISLAPLAPGDYLIEISAAAASPGYFAAGFVTPRLSSQ